MEEKYRTPEEKMGGGGGPASLSGLRNSHRVYNNDVQLCHATDCFTAVRAKQALIARFAT